MSKINDNLPSLKWPKWRWVFNIGIGLVASVIGLVVFFVPLFLEEAPVRVFRIVGVVIFMGWCVVPTIDYLYRLTRTCILRITYYECAYEKLQEQGQSLASKEAELNELRPFIGNYNFERVLWIEDTNGDMKVHIVVAKDELAQLRIGDLLRVVDTSDESEMGTFEVVSETLDTCTAIERSIEALWKSYIQQENLRQQYPEPRFIVQYTGRGKYGI